MIVGQRIKIRDNIPVEEYDYIGVPAKYVQGLWCTVSKVVPAGDSRDGLRNVDGPCDGLLVVMEEGMDTGGRWWVPVSWATEPPCMFEKVS